MVKITQLCIKMLFQELWRFATFIIHLALWWYFLFPLQTRSRKKPQKSHEISSWRVHARFFTLGRARARWRAHARTHMSRARAQETAVRLSGRSQPNPITGSLQVDDGRAPQPIVHRSDKRRGGNVGWSAQWAGCHWQGERRGAGRGEFCARCSRLVERRFLRRSGLGM